MPLKGETLKGYNNLPAIPIEQPLGDLLNTIPVGDPALENPAGGVATLYVSATGSDDTGDGSQAKPYATPQMAIDSIPATIAKDSNVQIFCGAGTFTFPDVSRVPSNIKCQLIGDVSNPAITIPVGSTSFAPIAGKNARWQANVGPYADVITDGSHWMFSDLTGSGFASLGLVVTASTSPNLDAVLGFDYASFYELKVFPYSTVFEVNQPKDFEGPLGSTFNTNKVTVIGVDVKGYNVNPYFSNINFFGCKFSLGAGFFSPTFMQASMYSYFEVGAPLENNCFMYNCYFKSQFSARGSSSSTTVGESVLASSVSVLPNGSLGLYAVDFEGSGDCIRLLSQARLQIFGDCSVEPTKSTFINGSSAVNASIEISGGNTITGSVTGNAITLVKGSQATGIENACNGTLTAGGSEIVVGGNAGQTFASLPATDLGAASPQLCRAD